MEFEIVKKIISEVMKVDPKEVTADTTFVSDLGADSLDIMRILLNIEEQFNIELPDAAVYEVSKVSDAVTLINKIKKN